MLDDKMGHNMQEQLYDEILIIDSIFAGLWLIVLALWVLNNCIYSFASSNLLQMTVTFAIALKFVYNLTLSALLLFEEEARSKYLNLLINSSFSLYNTFKYSSLILISKGFFFTRTRMDRREVTILALIMGVLYLTFSAYNIEKSKIISLVLILLVLLYIFVVRCARQNILLLKRRSYQIRNNLHALVSTLKKIHSMKIFLWCVNILFVQIIFSQLVLHLILQPLYFYDNLVYKVALALFDHATEFVCLCVVYFVFRAKRNRWMGRVLEVDHEPRQVVPFYKGSKNAQIRNANTFVMVIGNKAIVATRSIEIYQHNVQQSNLEEPLLRH